MSYPALASPLVEADHATLRALDGSGLCEGVVGRPEVTSRVSHLRLEHHVVDSPFPSDEELMDIQPASMPGVWWCLSSAGVLSRVNFRDRRFESLYKFADLGFEIDQEVMLSVAPQQDFAALLHASGPSGIVFELGSGRTTALLNRGSHHPENSCFPFAFFSFTGRTLAVTGTAWNRLDIIDPSTGSVLTERTLPEWRSDEPRSSRHLDYFHAGLCVSPRGHRIADNGWVWHPTGIIRSWSLDAWASGNSWESEDGPTLKQLAWRSYYWDGPLCWIDDETLAIWGWGVDDEWLIPAVRLLDVNSGEQVGWFAGPHVRPTHAWPPKKPVPSLFFDRYLFSVSDEAGLAVWDVGDGHCLLRDSSIAPIHYHPGSKEFLSRSASGFTLTRVVA